MHDKGTHVVWEQHHRSRSDAALPSRMRLCCLIFCRSVMCSTQHFFNRSFFAVSFFHPDSPRTTPPTRLTHWSGATACGHFVFFCFTVKHTASFRFSKPTTATWCCDVNSVQCTIVCSPTSNTSDHSQTVLLTHRRGKFLCYF